MSNTKKLRPRPRPTPTTGPDALATEAADVAGVPATFEAFGREWTVVAKPPPLMLSELARTRSGSDDALGVIADLFEHVVGPKEYPKFRAAYYLAAAADTTGDGYGEELFTATLADVLEASLGRPTR